MKKALLYCTAALALAAAACEPEEGKTEFPTPDAGATYTLEGTVSTPGFTWKTNSSIGLYSATEGVKIVNKECKITGWADTNLKDTAGVAIPYDPSPYEGQAVAPFTTPAVDLIAGTNEFMAYTPYDAELTYLYDVIYGLEVGRDQVQPVADVASDCFAFGTFSGIPGVDDKFNFTLNPITSLIQVEISSSEFAGLGITGLELVDRDSTAAIGGAFNINTKTKEVTTLPDYKYPNVAVKVTKPTPIVAGTAQNYYIQAIPGDYSANDMWLVIKMESEAKYVTMPVKLSNLVLEAGQTKKYTFSDLKSSDCSLAWYCPVETRKQPALGYCYGESNCYLIQCKNSAAPYTGATYTADPSIPDEVTIDFRARGNFANAVDPTGATFEWYQHFGKTYIPQYDGYTNVTNSDQFTITPDAATYTVKVKNTGAVAGAPILVMKKDGKILWAWSFWNITPDGTTLKAVPVGEAALANMDLGQNTTQFKAWAANNNPKKNPIVPDVNYRFNYYYQWGRPTPVFWSSWPTNKFYESNGGNVPVIEGQLSFAASLANPVGMILKKETGPSNRIVDWADDNSRYGDLWGGGLNAASVSEKGTKTIYDPCPKGWRVPDPSVFETVAQGNGTTDSTTPGAYTVKFSTSGDNYFTFNGRYEDYIAAATTPTPRVATMGMPQKGDQKTYGHLWTNWVGWHKGIQPKMFMFEDGKANTSTLNRAIAASVRCQKDTDNR